MPAHSCQQQLVPEKSDRRSVTVFGVQHIHLADRQTEAPRLFSAVLTRLEIGWNGEKAYCNMPKAIQEMRGLDFRIAHSHREMMTTESAKNIWKGYRCQSV